MTLKILTLVIESFVSLLLRWKNRFGGVVWKQVLEEKKVFLCICEFEVLRNGPNTGVQSSEERSGQVTSSLESQT